MSTELNISQPAPAPANICVIVVAYFPDSGLAQRVRRIKQQVAQVVIVDNGSTGDGMENVRKAASEPGITLLENGKNLGIATALNRGVNWAMEHRFAWVLLLDDDTIPGLKMVEKLIKAYDSFPGKNDLAIIGSPGIAAALDEDAELPSPAWVSRNLIITSGSLVSRAAIEKLGLFRDDFFMDCVDLEYCLRARTHGLQTIEVAAPVMQHFNGIPQTRRILWKEAHVLEHVPWRWYYMSRNFIFLWRDYLRKEPRIIIGLAGVNLKMMLRMLVLERSRLAKVVNITRGLWHGIRGRSGYVLP